MLLNAKGITGVSVAERSEGASCITSSRSHHFVSFEPLTRFHPHDEQTKPLETSGVRRDLHDSILGNILLLVQAREQIHGL